jgi:hypothetical protein
MPITIPKRARRHRPRIVILVIILTFVVIMTVLGYPPVAALGIASAALAMARYPTRPQRAVHPAQTGAR